MNGPNEKIKRSHTNRETATEMSVRRAASNDVWRALHAAKLLHEGLKARMIA